MSLLPIEQVRGEHLVERETPAVLAPGVAMAPVEQLLQAAGKPLREIRYRTLLGRNVVEVEGVDGTSSLHDARTAKPLGPLGAGAARAIALAAYRGAAPGQPSVRRITTTSTEYKGALPAWRVDFPDASDTRVYVVAGTGRIAAVRTGTWRLYDFFWGLHIMDWKNHEDFNTPWMIAFAAGGVLLSLAGSVLLYMRWPRRRWRRKSKG